jgi:hypothetical protein
VELGDVVPQAWRARVLTVVEAGLGFGFLALVIGYFPVTYQAFSSREADISLLDARAGSPPSAAEMLRRHRGEDGLRALEAVLHEWEHWATDAGQGLTNFRVRVLERTPSWIAQHWRVPAAWIRSRRWWVPPPPTLTSPSSLKKNSTSSRPTVGLLSASLAVTSTRTEYPTGIGLLGSGSGMNPPVGGSTV